MVELEEARLRPGGCCREVGDVRVWPRELGRELRRAEPLSAENGPAAAAAAEGKESKLTSGGEPEAEYRARGGGDSGLAAVVVGCVLLAPPPTAAATATDCVTTPYEKPLPTPNPALSIVADSTSPRP